MASIPLPELDAHPPNMLEEYARAVSLKGMMQQQQQQQAMAPLQQQQAQQQVEAGGVELQQKKQALKDQQAMTESMQQWDPKDVEGIVPLMIKHGASAQAVFGMKSQITKQLQEKATLDKDTLANNAAKNDQLLGALTAASEGDDATLAQRIQGAAQDQLQRGNLDPQHAQQLQQLLAQPPDAIRKALPIIEKTLQGQKEQFSQALEKQKADSEAWKSDGQGLLVNVRTGEKMAGNQPVEQKELADYLNNSSIDKGVKKDAATFATWKAKQAPIANFNLQQGALTDQAKDMLGQNFRQTGALPSGMRSPGMAAAAINNAASGGPVDIASAKADYGADSASLKKLRTNFDQVSAFENTALKNLDLYIEKAKAIPDLGSRFANIPIRMLSAKMIGDENMAALNAARQTAAAETAKVLGSANASGVLSDSQKKEAQDVLDGNLPLKASIAVAQTLKQDFSNRHTSYQQQIEQIQGRIKGGNGKPAASTGKTLSTSALEQAAKDHGVSLDEARKQAEAAGYTIQQ